MKRTLSILLCLIMIFTMIPAAASADTAQGNEKEVPLTIEVPNFNGGVHIFCANSSSTAGNGLFGQPITVKFNGEKVTAYEVIPDTEYFKVEILSDGRFKLYPKQKSDSAAFTISYDGTDYAFAARITSGDANRKWGAEKGDVRVEYNNPDGSVAFQSGPSVGDKDRLGNGFYRTPISVRFNYIRISDYEVFFSKDGYYDLEYLSDGRFVITPLKITDSIDIIIRCKGYDYIFKNFIEKYDINPVDFETASKEEIDEVIKDTVENIQISAKSAKTTKNGKKAIKVTVKADVQDILNLGYKVEYEYYRSTKSNKEFKKIKKVTEKNTYTNTSGKTGTKYYYKAVMVVKDDAGEVIAKTALKQCKYAARTW